MASSDYSEIPLEEQEFFKYLQSTCKYYTGLELKVLPALSLSRPYLATQGCFFTSIHTSLPNRFTHPEEVSTLLFPERSMRELIEREGVEFTGPMITQAAYKLGHSIVIKVTNSPSVDGLYRFGAGPAIFIEYLWGKHYQALYLVDPMDTLPPQGKVKEALAPLPLVVEDDISVNELKTNMKTAALTDCLAKLLEDVHLTDLPKHFKNALVASIISSLTSIISSLTALYQKPSKSIVITNGISLTTNLTSFAYNIYTLSLMWKVEYNIKKVINEIPMLIRSYSDEAIVANTGITDYVKPAISFLVSILLGGLTTANIASIKDVISLGSYVRATTTISDAANSAVDFVLNDLFSLDTKGDIALYDHVIQQATRSSELVTIHVYNYLADGALWKELQEFHQKSIELCNKVMKDHAKSRALVNAKQIIVNNLSLITEKVKAVQAVKAQGPRIETLAVLFAGPPGIGKSFLLTQVNKKIASILNYNPTIYNLVTGNGFSLPSGGEHFASFNEFMGRRADNDEFLPKFNNIVSGDPCNLESAHLDGKVQPVNFKLVYLTSNDISPQIQNPGGLAEGAAKAVWSRTLRFRISDPAHKGRMADNEHRKPDCSHLIVEYVTSTEELGNTLTYKTMSIYDMIDLIISQMVRREQKFIETLSDELRTSETVKNRLLFLKNIKGHHSNSEGTQYFVIRYQGIGGTGKTHCTTNLITKLRPQLKRHILVNVHDFDTYPENIGIYVIDDIILSDVDRLKYFKWINNGHPENIYIICTNNVIKRKTPILSRLTSLYTGDTGSYYDLGNIDLPTGFARRCGLYGMVKLRDELMFNPEDTSHTINTYPGFKLEHNGLDVGFSELANRIFKSYQRFLLRMNKIVYVDEPYIDDLDYTVEIHSTSLNKLTTTLRSHTLTAQAFTNSLSHTRFLVNEDFVKTVFNKTFVKDWQVPERVENLSQFEDLCSRMIGSLIRLKPDATVSVKIEGYAQMVYKDGVIYRTIYDPSIHKSCELKDGIIYYNKQKIPPKDYAVYVVNRQYSPIMNSLSLDGLAELAAYYNTLTPEESTLYSTAIKLATNSSQIKLSYATYLKAFGTNKIVYVAGSILALAGSVGIIYGVYKLFKRSPKETNKSNTEKYDPQEFDEFTQRFVQASLKGSRVEVDLIRRDAQEAGFLERLNEWEFNWRTGNTAKEQIRLLSKETKDNLSKVALKANTSTLCSYIKDYPEYFAERAFQTTKSNMLTIKEEIKSPITQIDRFNAKLVKNYCRVTTSAEGRTIGTNYALAIRGHLLVTVAHAIVDMNTDIIVSSGGISYKARVKAIARKRDIAFIEITDKTCPLFPDLTKHFLKEEKYREIVNIYYLRVSSVAPLYVQAGFEFFKTSKNAITDNDNPLLRCDEYIFKVDFLQLDNQSQVIRNGDCGMPLICLLDNQIYIVGIHNTFGMMAWSTFCALTSEDVMCGTYQKSNSEVPINNSEWYMKMPTCPDTVYSTHPYIYNGISNIEPSKFSNLRDKHFNLVGYAPKLHFYSAPKHSKVYHPINGAKTRCTMRPSAITYQVGRMDPGELVKDKYDVPSTLMTQAVKYKQRTPTYQKWDRELYEYTLSLIKLRTRRDFGPLRCLNKKEVLNGLDKLSPFDLTTSAGPYFKQKYGITNKSRLIDNLAPEGKAPYYAIAANEYGKDLDEQYQHYLKGICEGRPVFMLSKDNAKVELLPDQKVKQGKVRLFNEVDLALNMVLKKFFGFGQNAIQRQWHKGPYAMGANFYTLGSYIMFRFDQVLGDIQSTDYKNLDKSVPAELIEAFVDTFCDYMPTKERRALSLTLTNALHTQDGHLYFVHNGNESGTFVTTMLNCYVVDVVEIYTFVQKYLAYHQRLPTLNELENHLAYFALGDDVTLKCIPRYTTMEDRIKTASLFNLQMTPAKIVSQYPSFCSREMIPSGIHPQVYFPRLKKESIITCLYYYKKATYSQLAANINVALFEASLWDKTFFSEVEHDCMIIVKKHHLESFVEFYNYEDYRKLFASYILQDTNTPILLAIGGQVSEFNRIHANSTKQLSSLLRSIFENREMDSISLLNEYRQKHGLEAPLWRDVMEGEPHQPIWTSVLRMNDVDQAHMETTGIGSTKINARQKAAGKLVEILLSKAPMHVTANSGSPNEFNFVGYDVNIMVDHVTQKYVATIMCGDVFCGREIANTRARVLEKVKTKYCGNVPRDFVKKCLICQRQIAQKVSDIEKESDVWLWVDRTKVLVEDDRKIVNDGIRYIRNKGKLIVLSCTSQEFTYAQVKPFYKELGTNFTNDGMFISFERSANTGGEIEHTAIRQAAVSQVEADLPRGLNPQPTGQAPALAPVGEDVMSALEGIKKHVLNPMNTPNMLPMGAITFDAKTLPYEQFIDSDVEYTFTDDVPPGTILVQIPYNPMDPIFNRFINQWVGMHDRYTGPLLVRVTVIGNPLFSGFVAVSWQPRKVAGTTIPISTSQVYAYNAKNVTIPFSEVHELHDARQNQFYRRVSDISDVDERPHLVIHTVTTLQNPLKPGAVVRIRIATKLASPADGTPFVVVAPNTALQSTDVTTRGITPVFQFPPDRKMWLYTDGTVSHPTHEIFNKSTDNFDQWVFKSPHGVATGEQVATFINADTVQSQAFRASSKRLDGDPWASFDEWPFRPINYSQLHIVATSNMSTADVVQYMGNPSGDNFYDSPKFSWENQWVTGKRWEGMLGNPRQTIKYIIRQVLTPRILYYSANVGVALMDSIKLVTSKGTVLLNLFMTATDRKSPEVNPFDLTPYIKLDRHPSLGEIPNLNVESLPLVTDSSAEYLPLGTVRIVVTDISPSSVVSSDFNMPTANNYYFTLQSIKDLDTSRDNEALEIDFIDRRNTRRILTARYLKGTQDLIISPTQATGANYRVMPIDLDNVFYQTRIVPTSNEITKTDVSLWVSRQSVLFLEANIDKSVTKPADKAAILAQLAEPEYKQRINSLLLSMKDVSTDELDTRKTGNTKWLIETTKNYLARERQYHKLIRMLEKDISDTEAALEKYQEKDIFEWVYEQPNLETLKITNLDKLDYPTKGNAQIASMFFGGTKGVAEGLNAIADRNFAKHILNVKHLYNKEIQQNQFGHESGMQGNMFKHEANMQHKQFGYDSLKEDQRRQWDSSLSRQNARQQMAIDNNRAATQLMAAGISAPSRKMPGQVAINI